MSFVTKYATGIIFVFVAIVLLPIIHIKVVQLGDAYTEAKKEINKKDSQVRHYVEELEKVKHGAENDNRKLKSVSKQLEQCNSKHDEEKSSLDSEIHDLRQKLIAAETSVKDAQSKKGSLDDKIRDLEDKLKEVESERDEYKQRMVELNVANAAQKRAAEAEAQQKAVDDDYYNAPKMVKRMQKGKQQNMPPAEDLQAKQPAEVPHQAQEVPQEVPQQAQKVPQKVKQAQPQAAEVPQAPEVPQQAQEVPQQAQKAPQQVQEVPQQAEEAPQQQAQQVPVAAKPAIAKPAAAKPAVAPAAPAAKQ